MMAEITIAALSLSVPVFRRALLALETERPLERVLASLQLNRRLPVLAVSVAAAAAS